MPAVFPMVVPIYTPTSSVGMFQQHRLFIETWHHPRLSPRPFCWMCGETPLWFHMHFHRTCEVEPLLLWLLAIYKSSLVKSCFKGLTWGSGMGKNPEMGQGKAVRSLGPPFY